MRRWFLLALGCAAFSVAGGQTSPYSSPGMPQQPVAPPQPGQPQASQPTDPNAVGGAPPAFVPGLGAADEPSPAQPRTIRISGGVMEKNVVSKVSPTYPADAKDAHLEGTVVMAARVGTNGHVESLAVVSGPRLLQRAAVDAVKQWTYRPYLLNGQAVEVNTTVTVNFHLQ